MNVKRIDSIREMFDRVLKYVPGGRCFYCNKDVINSVVINEKTPEITSCPHCHRSFVE